MKPVWLAFICGIAVGWAIVPFILYRLEALRERIERRRWDEHVDHQRFSEDE